MIKRFLISFKKSLKSTKAQTVVEYCLVLVVTAAILVSLFANNFSPIQQMFNVTTTKIINRLLEAPPGSP